MKLLERSYIFIISIIIYRLLLDYIYMEVIGEVFNYMGFLIDENDFSYYSSWILLFILILFMVKIVKMNLFSSNVMMLLFLISFVPMTSLMRFNPMDFNFFILYSTYWLALILYYLFVSRFKVNPNNFKTKISMQLWFLIIFFLISILFLSGYYHNFRFTINLSDVYAFRTEQRESNYPSIFGYIIPAASNILPLFLVYFLIKKKYIWVIILSVVMIFNFSLGGHKSVLANLFLVFLGYLFFNYKSIYKYSWALISLILISIIELKTFSTIFITNFIVRRVLFIPAKLNYYYYDFFSKNSPDFYLQGPLRRLGLESEYKTSIPRIIGEQYYNSYEMSANNGLFSDAYANLNILGVLILPLIIVFIFKLGDSVSIGLPGKLMFLPIIAFTTSFISGFFTSVLLTNGILLLLICLYYYPRDLYSKLS